MANRDGREALRGAEIQTFDLLADVLTPQQWAELLKAPLEHAVVKGHRDIAQRLLGAGAEIRNALHAATRGGHGEIVNDLLENGASVADKDSVDGSTPLHIAARAGKTEMVQLLLLKGADKDALDDIERTPLYLAASYGHMSAALALMAAGADVRLRCLHSKMSVTHIVAEHGHVEALNAVIARGGDVHAVEAYQETPLHIAAETNETKAIDVLMGAGANIEARAVEGSTPLHSAARHVSVEALLLLLEHGAHVNAQNDYQETPLHAAAAKAGKEGAADVVDSLLRSGADETILDDYGRAAADVVGENIQDDDELTEDIDRVRELLANAPADRAWRRRGYLVMCRAYSDRNQQLQDIGSACADVARTTRKGARTAGGGTADGGTGGDWAGLMARVLVLQEEDVFRTIVEYL